MKWHAKAWYLKALYVVMVLGSLVAAASAGLKWW
jgi:hypothetical protein